MSKLVEFGFTANQAKVYLAIAYSGCTTISQISEVTKIHPQDIYKIISALQQRGIIHRTLNKPVKVEAVPIEKCLKLMLELKKQKFNSRLAELNQTRLYVEKAWGKTTKKTSSNTGDAEFFVFKTESNSAIGKMEMMYDNVSAELDVVLSTANFEPQHYNRYAGNYLEMMKRRLLSKPRLKVHILIITGNCNDSLHIDAINNVIPYRDNCEIKTLENEDKFHFFIADFKEVYVNGSYKKSQAIFTDSEGLIAILRYAFNKLWNDPKAKNLTRTPKKRQSKKPTTA